MSDIFISYARSTADQAQAIAVALRGLGYDVWRDDELPAHRSYAEVIEERLLAAKAVVVIWSAEAVKSEWVQSEADTARTERKLVQLTVDGSKLPRPFDRIQCADMAGWTGDLEAPGWRKVAASVAELIGGVAVQAAPQPAVRKLSICVLPFANMSGDPEQEYFSDGISEDIITDLNKVSALNVTARNTAFNLKGKGLDSQDVARRMGVSHVLEGSVRKAGNRVRISAQLADGATGDQVWAERWDRDLTDIFALQDEISQAVVAVLKVKLLPEERKAIEQRGTENVEAYNLYLMARRHYLGQSAKRWDLVIRLCQGAIEMDPAYARAWALMAACKAAAATSYHLTGASDDGWAEAEQALALDPDLAEAHAAKAKIMTDRGNFSQAQTEIETALAIDPDSVEVNRAAGTCALVNRRFAEAIRFFEAAADADDMDGSSPFMAMQCYEALGDREGSKACARKAVDRLERAITREPDNGSIMALGVGALVLLGEVDRARDWARHAVLIDPKDGNLRYNIACAMMRLGDVDLALEYLEAAFDRGGAALVTWANEDSDLDRLREDPRFLTMIGNGQARPIAEA
ncbi:MAG TPA: TIR domain-containing protein [Caulobacteraceae bacterium]|nr:TIR domain-containing protein [Caulobacteraceae bacterium]